MHVHTSVACVHIPNVNPLHMWENSTYDIVLQAMYPVSDELNMKGNHT
jgi:hypothetical protein